MTFHEKTTALVNYRGKIKAALIGDAFLKIGYTTDEANQFWEDVRQIVGIPKAGTFWFKDGFAQWNKWTHEWNYVTVPEIPEELL